MRIKNNNKLTSGVSIIVCCYNSTERIIPTIERIAKQTAIGSVPMELIIVDNASTDDLSGVVETCWIKFGNPFPIRVITENEPGLSFARKAGVLAAVYECGIFCDDDNWLAADYVARAVDIFKNHPKVGVIGGASLPVLESDPPAWFFSKCSSYAIGIQGEKTGDITNRHFIWGAGMAFRLDELRSIYNAGIIPLLSDRKKNASSYGGDGEICIWFILRGYRLFYDSEMLFKHFIPKSRLTNEYYNSFFNCLYPEIWTYYEHYLNLKPGLISRVPFRFYLSPVYIIYKIKSALFFVLHLQKSLQMHKVISKVKHA